MKSMKANLVVFTAVLTTACGVTKATEQAQLDGASRAKLGVASIQIDDGDAPATSPSPIFEGTVAEGDKDYDCSVPRTTPPSERDQAEIDALFMRKFDELGKQDKKTLIKHLQKLLAELKPLTEKQRQKRLAQLCPPLPSKSVLDDILPKPKPVAGGSCAGAPAGDPTAAQLAENDRKFLATFSAASMDEKKQILAMLKEVMDHAQSLPNEQARKDYFKTLCPPPPSKEVIDSIVAQYPLQ